MNTLWAMGVVIRRQTTRGVVYGLIGALKWKLDQDSEEKSKSSSKTHSTAPSNTTTLTEPPVTDP